MEFAVLVPEFFNVVMMVGGVVVEVVCDREEVLELGSEKVQNVNEAKLFPHLQKGTT